ncbi:MAG: recombinase family protein [Bacteroidales bacterium]|nr:recombinase family protein [Bacteroidales bacterium]
MDNRAVIYARVSSTSDRQNTDRQIVDLQSYAERAGLEIVEIYQEKASGAKDDRPVLAECISNLMESQARNLLLSEISRLSRTMKGVVNTLDQLAKAGVNVYIQDIGLNSLLPDGSENPTTKMMLTILALGAEMERNNIHNRMESGRRFAYERNPEKFGRPKGKKRPEDEILSKYPEVVKKLSKAYNR